MVLFFGAGDEEIADAPPVAEEARRFRGNAPIGGHDSGRESAGMTVSTSLAERATRLAGGPAGPSLAGLGAVFRPRRGLRRGGGGQPGFAQAGGKDASGIDAACASLMSNFH